MPSARFWRKATNATAAGTVDSTTANSETSQDRDADPDSKTSNGFHLRDRQASSEAPATASSDDNALATADTADTGAAQGSSTTVVYRTYKRRWFGLCQLTLMNVVVSWGWLTYAPVASNAATYFSVTESAINWLSIAFFLSFVVVSPISLYVLHHHHGLRISLCLAALLLLIGNWVRYAGSTDKSEHGGKFGYAMAGEILIGFSQPFVLAAPTRYSDLWFTNRGRVGATALATLANPFGGALGQLINPFWVSKPGDVSDMVLWVSVISTVACVPSFFIASHPPTPVGPSSTTPKLNLRASLPALHSLELYLIFIPFTVYVGFFNSISSLLNQILTPYDFTDDQAGIAGAVLIVVGLVVSGCAAPVIDRTKKFLLAIKVLVPLIALSYLIFVWMPQTRSLPGPFIILALLGATSFCLLPIALEYLIELSHPLNPAVTSTVAWTGGQLFGAIFVLISDALTDGKDASPPKNMHRALVFQAVVACAVMPAPLCLGLFGRAHKVVLRRVRSDEGAGGVQTVTGP
ncbi:hypothetical protein NLU13_7762 [Sarocladium strictum]|uniref:Uncharacterized protein n=1 Tax=Sarocladium strictum TaxID=5046 RepID=A0AA39GDZ5_SARSR|nr:hypothetical protein NLU13_7762 [Sarocladium strictum]